MKALLFGEQQAVRLQIEEEVASCLIPLTWGDPDNYARVVRFLTAALEIPGAGGPGFLGAKYRTRAIEPRDSLKRKQGFLGIGLRKHRGDSLPVLP